MTNTEIIAVVQADTDGKTILYRARGYLGGPWKRCDGPLWDFVNNDYCVMPEPRKPREWWVNIYRNPFNAGSAYAREEIADANASPGRTECIRVREVIEEEEP